MILQAKPYKLVLQSLSLYINWCHGF